MEIPSEVLDKEKASRLLENIDNVFLDCDGVIWGAEKIPHLFPNVEATIDMLRSLGKKIFFVTNNSRSTKNSIVKKIVGLGINVKEEEIVCSPYIMGAYLKKINFQKKVYIIGSEGLADELRQWNIRCIGPTIENFKTPGKSYYEIVEDGDMNLDCDVGAVVVGFDENFDFSKLLKASCYLSNPDCFLIATNPDVLFPVWNTPYSLPAAGVMVKAVEAASGKKAIIIGKPSTMMFDILSEKYNLDPSRSLMIGDTIITDIIFGNKCGMKTLFVLSGVSTIDELLAKHKENPEDTQIIPTFYTDFFSDLLKFK